MRAAVGRGRQARARPSPLEPILKLMLPAEKRSSRRRIEAARGSEHLAFPTGREDHGIGCARSSCARRPSVAVCRVPCRGAVARPDVGCVVESLEAAPREQRAGSRIPCRGRDELAMNRGEHAELHPLLKSQVARRARTEVVRQRLPLTASPQPVEDARHHDSSGNSGSAASRLRSLHRDQRLDLTP
jgi:hypothetical protein